MRTRLVIIAALATLLLGLVPAASAAPRANEPDAPEFVSGEVLVGFAPGTSANERAKARASASSALAETVAAGGDGYARVELVTVRDGAEASTIARLEKNPNVAFAEPNWVLTSQDEPTDTYYADGTLWGLYGDDPGLTASNAFGSQAAEAWASDNTGDPTVYVAVIDTGVQASHPDLGNVDPGLGRDFVNDDDTTYDGAWDDHGTHVAGTIGATANEVGVVGVAHDIGIIPVKFLGPEGGSTADAVKAVDYVTGLKTAGTNVVATNNSWGGGGSSSALYDAIDRAGTEGILFVAAAGNGDWRGRAVNTDSRPHYPSSYGLSSIISVTAIDAAGSRPRWANYGSSTVDIGAPGADIWSTLPDNSYGAYSGTSMAAPHVTGAVALYASAYPEASAADIKDAILGSAVPTSSMGGRTVTGGRLDASSFVAAGTQGQPIEPNEAPKASFDVECVALTCEFTDTSTDDGSIASWFWDFGDGRTSGVKNPTYQYEEDGGKAYPLTYDVTLKVVDDASAAGEVTTPVMVDLPEVQPGTPIALEAETSTRGTNKVTLIWAGASGVDVEIWRNGETLTTTVNDGSHTDNTGPKSSGAFTYQVCETGGFACSDEVPVAF